jgi:uncharacterized OsmC-like protein
VEGDIQAVEGVLKITEIRLHYRIKAAADSRDRIQRAVVAHAEACPAYQSVKGCIDCSWTFEILDL